MKKILQTLLLALVLAGLQSPASAGMIGTSRLSENAIAGKDLETARRTIERQLVELGVAATEARNRAQSLSDTQVAELNRKLEELPAGADAAGILLTVFIVFVITDVIGATDIFPFIHPVKTR